MILGTISDTHGKLPDPTSWPHVDVFVHLGDAAPNPTNTEADLEVQRAWLPSFIQWFRDVPADQRLYVPGNHDLFAQELVTESLAGVQLLSHHATRLDALISARVFGSAWTFQDQELFPFPWAFGAGEGELERRFAAIPTETSVLLTHSGRRYVLDNQVGREVGTASLDARTRSLEAIRLHIHGHAHDSGGSVRTVGERMTVNAACHLMHISLDDEGVPIDAETIGHVDALPAWADA